MKKHRFQTIVTNAIDPASTTAKNWGLAPVPRKGGNTTNAEIPDWMILREQEEKPGDFA